MKKQTFLKRALSFVLLLSMLLPALATTAVNADDEPSSEPTYTITWNGTTTSYSSYDAVYQAMGSFNYTEVTSTKPVVVEVKNATIGKADVNKHKITGGWRDYYLLYDSYNCTYTTVRYTDCTLDLPDCCGFSNAKIGNKLEFVGCNFTDYGIYGININNGGDTSNYSTDILFSNCTFDRGCIDGGGCWFGDVTITNCRFTGKKAVKAVNCTSGYSEAGSQYTSTNSVRGTSTFTMTGCIFDKTIMKQPLSLTVAANCFGSVTINNTGYAFYGLGYNNYLNTENFTAQYDKLQDSLLNNGAATGTFTYSNQGAGPWFLMYTPDGEAGGSGPFYVVSKTQDYPTLQEAVDAAAAEDTILIHPCSDYGVTEYDYTFTTNVNANLDATHQKGRVYFGDKNIKLQNEPTTPGEKPSRDSAVLDGFEIVLRGSTTTKSDYTFDTLSFTGASVIFLKNGNGADNLGDLVFNNIFADVTQGYITYAYVIDTQDGVTIGTDNYAHSVFIQSIQRNGSGTIDSFTLTNSDIAVSDIAVSDSDNWRIVNGSMRCADMTITNNRFGTAEKRVGAYVVVSERSPHGTVTCEFSGNTIYAGSSVPKLLYYNADHSDLTVSIDVHENNIYTTTGNKPTTLPSIGECSVTMIKDGTVITYHNYINGYCENEFRVSTDVTLNKQIGHTYDDQILPVPTGSIKVADTYQNNKADAFTGTTHSVPIVDLGTTHYCARCDQLIACFYVVHSSDPTTAEEIPLPTLGEDGKFNITTKVKDGYLYGGLATNEQFTTALSGANGLSLTPTAGATYYLREVSDEYLKPALISVRRQHKDTTVEHYAVTAIDEDGVGKQFYTGYGFVYNFDADAAVPGGFGYKRGQVNTGSGEEIYDESQGNEDYENMSCLLYDQIDVYDYNTYTTTWTPGQIFGLLPWETDEGKGYVTDDDYFGCTPVEPDFRVTDGQYDDFAYSFCYVPYYVTADGVLVTGISERFVNDSDQASVTPAAAKDKAVGSHTYGDEVLPPAALTGSVSTAHSMIARPGEEEAKVMPEHILSRPVSLKRTVPLFAARSFVTLNGHVPADSRMKPLPCGLSVLVYLR